MVAPSKNGRAADELARDKARRLAETFRKVSNSPTGAYCVNPEDPAEEQSWINTSQALDFVLSALEAFARTGNFGAQFDVRKFGVREEYRAARAKGVNRNDAINLLVDKHGMSRSVVERTIRQKGEPPPREKERLERELEHAVAAAKAVTARLNRE